MGKMKDLHTAGVTDVNSYLIGKEDAIARVIKLLDELAADAPMRGDIALSDLRRKIEADND